MLKLSRRAMADCLMAALILGSSAAFAANKEPPKVPISRDKVRLILLDNCVIDQWRTRDVKDRIADQCKCASAKVARQLSDSDIRVFKDKLPRSATPAWQAAMRYCLNPPRPKPRRGGEGRGAREDGYGRRRAGRRARTPARPAPARPTMRRPARRRRRRERQHAGPR